MRIKKTTKDNIIFIIPAAALLLAVILLRERLTHILVPLALAFIIAKILEPLVNFFGTRKHFSMTGAVAAGMVIFVIVIGLILACLVPLLLDNLRDVANNAQTIRTQVEGAMGSINLWLQDTLGIREHSDFSLWMNEAANTLCERIFTGIESFALSLLDRVAKSYMEIFSTVLDVLTAFIMAFYFLKDRELLRGWVLAVFPYKWRSGVSSLMDELSKIFSDFLMGQLLVALIVGALETLGLFLLHVPYAPVLGFLGGILNIIPYFGPFIGAVPAVLAAFFTSPTKAIWTALLFIIIQQFDNNLLTPKIVEGKLGVHPITTILMVFIGGEFFGLAGILLAVPCYAALRAIIKKILPKVRLPA